MKTAILDAMIPASLRLLLQASPVVLADAGAAGGVHDRWSGFSPGELKVLGFEPDVRAFAGLIKHQDFFWVNAALGENSQDVDLLVTNHQTNTSLLRPNRVVIDRIYQTPADFDVVKSLRVPCTTLDASSQKFELKITSLKADTQGTELAILRGAEKCMAQSLHAVELEVEFSQLYADQPLFAEVDSFMRDHGFMLFDLGNLLCHKWKRSSHIVGRKGQLIAADALYFRSPESLTAMFKISDDPVAELAKFWAVCAAYGYADLAFEMALEQISLGALPDKVADDIAKWEKTVTNTSIFSVTRGRGKAANWLRNLADKVDVVRHSHWLNPLGNP